MRLLVLSFAAAFLGLAACDTTSSTIPSFGDPYTVERRQPAPVLDGDTLRVTVSYAGGCEEHTFEPATSLAGTEIWLRHDANGDSCEAYITRALALPVSLESLAPPPIRFYVSRTETIELVETSPRSSDLPEGEDG